MLKTLQVQILPVSPIIHFHFHLILFPQDSCRKLTKDIITQLYFIYTKGLNLIQGGSFPSGGLFSWITTNRFKIYKKKIYSSVKISKGRFHTFVHCTQFQFKAFWNQVCKLQFTVHRFKKVTNSFVTNMICKQTFIIIPDITIQSTVQFSYIQVLTLLNISQWFQFYMSRFFVFLRNVQSSENRNPGGQGGKVVVESIRAVKLGFLCYSTFTDVKTFIGSQVNMPEEYLEYS